VLLHGWGMNLRVFDGLRAALAEHHRVTAIDLAGHGASPWTADSSPQQHGWRALRPCCRAMRVLVGWSLGGQLALQLASRSRRWRCGAGADRHQPALRARR
jgi:pimeloyl-ACP methyl ester carboxylesterase